MIVDIDHMFVGFLYAQLCYGADFVLYISYAVIAERANQLSRKALERQLVQR